MHTPENSVSSEQPPPYVEIENEENEKEEEELTRDSSKDDRENVTNR